MLRGYSFSPKDNGDGTWDVEMGSGICGTRRFAHCTHKDDAEAIVVAMKHAQESGIIPRSNGDQRMRGRGKNPVTIFVEAQDPQFVQQHFESLAQDYAFCEELFEPKCTCEPEARITNVVSRKCPTHGQGTDYKSAGYYD